MTERFIKNNSLTHRLKNYGVCLACFNRKEAKKSNAATLLALIFVCIFSIYFANCTLNEKKELKSVYYRAATEIKEGIVLVSENKDDFYTGCGLSFSILKCNIAENSVETLYTSPDSNFFMFPKKFFLIHDSILFTTYNALYYIKDSITVEKIYDFEIQKFDSTGFVMYSVEDSILSVIDRKINVKNEVLEAKGKINSAEIFNGEYFLITSVGVEYFGDTTKTLWRWYDFWAEDYYFGEFHPESLYLVGIHNINYIESGEQTFLEIYCTVEDTSYILNSGLLKLHLDSWTDSGAVFDRTIKGKRMMNINRFLFSSDMDDYSISEGSLFVLDSLANVYFSLEEYCE